MTSAPPTLSGASVTGILRPGTDIEWLLTAPVISGAGLDVTETLSDGQIADSSFPAIVTASLNGVAVWQGVMSPSVSRNGGVSTLDFALAAALQSRGPIDTIQIRSRTVIDQVYAGPVQGSALVTQGDRLTNAAVVSGGGAASVTGAVVLPVSSATVSIVGVNGAAVVGTPHAAAGDAVTYQTVVNLPFTSARAFTITAGAPGPVGPTVFDSNPVNGLPAPGHAQFAPGGSYTATQPVVTVDGTGGLVFDFGTVQPVYGSGAGTIALRYTAVLRGLTAPSAPAATVIVSEQNSAGVASRTAASAAPLQLDRPALALQMASLYVSDYGAVFAGSGGPFGYDPNTGQFGGIISSAGLAAEPFLDSLTNLAAGDYVTFVVTIENTAPRAAAYGIILQDTLPAGFVLPPGGADVSITDGAGNLIGFTGDLFGPAGLQLDSAIAIAQYSADSGANVVLLTFSLQASDTVPILNTALNPVLTVKQVSAERGGGAAAPSGLTATTTVTTGAPIVTISDTAPRPVLVGDTVRFDVKVTLIPGSVPELRIDDLLTPSLSLISAAVVSTGAGLTVGAPSGLPGALSFGTVLDLSDGTNPGAEQFTVRYVARAIAGDPAAGFTASVSGGNGSGPRWSSAVADHVVVVSPALTVSVAAPAFAQAGQTVTITVTVANAPGAANAYGLTLANTVPPGLTVVSNSLSASGTRAAAVLRSSGLSVPELDAGETLTVSYRAQLAPGAGQTAATPSVLVSSATQSGYALPSQAASATVMLTQPALAILADAAQYRVGEVATFRFALTLPSGTSPHLRLQDTLPPGFDFVPGSAIVLDSSGASGTLSPAVTIAGQAVTLDLGSVTATGTRQIVLSFRATVSGAAALGPAAVSATVTTGYLGDVTAATSLTVADTAPALTLPSPFLSIFDTQVAVPLAGIQVFDPDLAGQQMQSVSVAADFPGHGTLAGFGPGYDPETGIYQLSGTAQQIASALSALTFTPARFLGPVGTAVTTRFTVTDRDAAGVVATAVATVAAVTSNTAPTLGGIWTPQITTPNLAISPFAGVSLSDPDIAQVERLTIRLNDPSFGVLSGQGGSFDPATGTYTASGSVAALQSLAQNLIFRPAHTGTAQLGITLDDGAGGSAFDRQTTVSIVPSADTSHVAQHFAASPSTSYLTASGGHNTLAHGEVYQGPVTTLQSQFIYDAGGSVVIVSKTPNSFVKSFSGFAAIALSDGSNVVDAGPGSNFLVGGTGADTFFLDGTHGDVVWDTIVGFHGGDHATLFGFHAGVSTFTWADNDGAAGYTGRTLHADLNGTGQVVASLTFTGTTAADTARFVVGTGTVGGTDYLSIYNPG